MNTIKVKTNIMCGACIAKVTPALNEMVGAADWSVDIANPQKILTATSENLTTNQLIRVLQKTGYRAEKMT